MHGELRPHFQAFCDFQEFLGRCRPFWLYRGVTSLAGEAQFTDLCKLMVDVLPRHYGIDEDGARFWSVHIPIDEEHTSTAVAIVGPYIDDPKHHASCASTCGYTWTCATALGWNHSARPPSSSRVDIAILT